MHPYRKPLQWRSFTTFLIVMMFVVLALTGIVLYITPPGRIANWSGWRLFGLTKAQWQSVHTIFSFLFVFAAGVHLFFNWKVLVNYLRAKIELERKYRRELIAASALVSTVLVLTINHVTPFGTVMDLGEDLKNSWSTADTEPPVPHAELLTITALATKLNVPSETLRQNLAAAGMSADNDDITLGAIAERHGMTPQQVYDNVSKHGQDTRKPVSGEGSGYGRKTVADLCKQLNIPAEEGIRRLGLRSIHARPEQNLRELATANGMTPMTIAQVISGKAE